MKITRHVIHFLFLLPISLPILIIQCQNPSTPQPTMTWEDTTIGTPLSEQENAIYRAVIGDVSLLPKGYGVCIYDSFSTSSFDSSCLQNPDTIYTRELVDKYFSLNSAPVLWRQFRLSLGIPYKFVGKAALDSIRASLASPLDFWNEFYRKYPYSKGYIIFSRVAFNADTTQALVSFEWDQNFLGAGGGFYVFTLTNSGWQRTAARCTWIS